MGENSWRVISQEGLVKGARTVSESQIIEALKVYRGIYLDIVEPSGVVALAGALFCSSSFGYSKPKGSTIKIAIVLTGGNVSRSTIDHTINHKAE